MRKDCNTCQCVGGVWTCTDNVCQAECHAYGPMHITTFDDHYYKFGQVKIALYFVRYMRMTFLICCYVTRKEINEQALFALMH